jgi:hypothetical protein
MGVHTVLHIVEISFALIGCCLKVGVDLKALLIPSGWVVDFDLRFEKSNKFQT